MKRTTKMALGAALGLLLTTGIASMAAAQPLSCQPLKLVVPASPGGSTDVLARSLAQVIQTQTGTSVIVENRGGAGGAIGVTAVVNAAADGCTLLVTVPDGVTVLPHLRKDIPYQALKDLAPIGLIAETYWLFAVNPKLPVKTIKDLIATAASKPGGVRYSSPGIGTSAHLITERFAQETKVEMLHVPYKGAGPAAAAVVSGEVDLIATSPISLGSFLETGKLTGLGITSPERLPALPAIPTMIESGLPGFAASAWFGVFAPAAVAPAQVDRLAAVVGAAAADPGLQKQLGKMGLSSRKMSRTEFVTFVADDSARWKSVIEKSKVKISE